MRWNPRPGAARAAYGHARAGCRKIGKIRVERRVKSLAACPETIVHSDRTAHEGTLRTTEPLQLRGGARLRLRGGARLRLQPGIPGCAGPGRTGPELRRDVTVSGAPAVTVTVLSPLRVPRGAERVSVTVRSACLARGPKPVRRTPGPGYDVHGSRRCSRAVARVRE
jgi:hypothetical protein